MPLAHYLVVLGVLTLSGCAQSSRAPVDPESGAVAAQQQLSIPFNLSIADASEQTRSGHCGYHQVKGIAEVVRVVGDEVVFRFSPGDGYFTRARQQADISNVRAGDEFKALRIDPVTPGCDHPAFELLGEFDDAQDDLLAMVRYPQDARF